MPHSRENQGAAGADAPGRARQVTLAPFPRSRAIVIHALRAGRRMAPVHGILQLDVTTARKRLANTEPPGSITAFIVGTVARAAANHPAVHAYRDWRGRIVTHGFVDIATMVEVHRADGPVPIAHLIRDADIRSIDELSSEIRQVKAQPTASRSGRMLDRAMPWLGRVPGSLSLFYRAIAVSKRARRMSGTVSVTSVGMFGAGSGAGIGHPTIHSLNVLVGGISERPVVVDGAIVVREVLDLTVTVDHNIVDGGPAARFVAELRSGIETAGMLE